MTLLTENVGSTFHPWMVRYFGFNRGFTWLTQFLYVRQAGHFEIISSNSLFISDQNNA